MPFRTLLKSLGVLLLVCFAQAAQVDPAADEAARSAQGLALFKEQVRGVLQHHCIKCHGGESIKAEFNMATREGLLAGGALGVAVVPGKSSESLLVKLIRHAEAPHMPHKGPKLADAEIAQIAAWIDAGAPYDKPLAPAATADWNKKVTAEDRKFWAFQPLTVPEPPAVKDQAWARTPIDRFVLARLEAKGIAPNPPASKHKLIRRLYLDLIGLPPTPAEVDAFVNDASPDAYDKLVDRLLESPHYGERWARHWLDLARFAESHGYEQDDDRPTAHHYRDFVIQAFNQDLPFDTFVKWQIAGDELEPNNPLAMMATGYLAAGTHATQITANQAEKERYDELDDMLATVGTSLLGMTIGCARCHDHKYDPIPQGDYYRLLSTFTTTVRSERDLNLHPERYTPALAEFEKQHAPLVAALQRFEREQLPARTQEWLQKNPRLSTDHWLIVEASKAVSAAGAALNKLADGSYLAVGKNAQFDTYTFVAQAPAKGLTAVRLEALADPSMVKGGPGRASNGNFALTDFRLTAGPVGKPAVAVKLAQATATFEQTVPPLPVSAAIDDNPTSAWAVDPQFGKDHAAVFQLAAPLDIEGDVELTFTLKFENNAGHNIGRPRLSITTQATPPGLQAAGLPMQTALQVRQAIATPAAERTDAQKVALVNWYRSSDPEWVKLNQAAEDHLRQTPKPELTKVLISSEGVPAVRLRTQGPDFYPQTFFLKRGDLNQKQGEAAQGFLQVLVSAPDQEKHWPATPPAGALSTYRRTALANWLVDTRYGAGALLARVIVNRLWQHHLGRGIVNTPSDFGSQGDRPSHPELLDWLAAECIAKGWRLKPIHKLIVTSSVYLQSSDGDEKRVAADPENMLYWRFARRRLEAEPIRDSLLAISGTLDPTPFGPGSLNEGMRRRSIYFTIKRSQLVGLMTLFDAPDSLQGLGRRSTTIVAPQALALLNNPHIRGFARELAKRLTDQAGGSAADQVRLGYRTALARPPSDEELSDALDFLKSQAAAYQAAGKGNGDSLALADFCQALMGLNEFVYVD